VRSTGIYTLADCAGRKDTPAVSPTISPSRVSAFHLLDPAQSCVSCKSRFDKQYQWVVAQVCLAVTPQTILQVR
jgi:hypothetical protein